MQRKFNRGEYVRVKGLVKRADLNGEEGIVIKEIGNRYEVEIVDKPSTFSLLPEKLEYLGQSCVVIGPCDKGISSDEIPIYTSYMEGLVEYKEIQELKSRFGWRSPVGMAWCSENAQYKDLYIYYDSESKETVNSLADLVFPAMSADKCCPSVPVHMPGRDDGIRGSVVIIRQEPPQYVDHFMVNGVEQTKTGQRDFYFDRLITHTEVRSMFNKAIKHQGNHSHHEKVKKAQEKKPTPQSAQLDKLTKMFNAKLGGGPGGVKFHDPNDITGDMYEYLLGK